MIFSARFVGLSLLALAALAASAGGGAAGGIRRKEVLPAEELELEEQRLALEPASFQVVVAAEVVNGSSEPDNSQSNNWQLPSQPSGWMLDVSGLISDFRLYNMSLRSDHLRHSTSVSVILTIAYSIVFVVGIVGNSFVVAIVCKSPRMRTVTNYFIANLALADILVLVFCLPATLVSNLFIPYVLGLFVCKTVSYLQGVAVSASINTMVAVTMDRFLSICFPLDWHMSRRTARWTIACIWLFSLCISLPWALYFTLVPYNLNNTTVHICGEVWPSERMGILYFVCANLILLYLLPATVIIICYLGIWYKVERRNIPGNRHAGVKVELIIQKSKLKVVKMMVVVVVIFLLSWAPLYLIFVRIKLVEDRSPLEEWLINNLMPLAQWKYKQGFIELLRFSLCCKSKKGTDCNSRLVDDLTKCNNKQQHLRPNSTIARAGYAGFGAYSACGSDKSPRNEWQTSSNNNNNNRRHNKAPYNSQLKDNHMQLSPNGNSINNPACLSLEVGQPVGGQESCMINMETLKTESQKKLAESHSSRRMNSYLRRSDDEGGFGDDDEDDEEEEEDDDDDDRDVYRKGQLELEDLKAIQVGASGSGGGPAREKSLRGKHRRHSETALVVAVAATSGDRFAAGGTGKLLARRRCRLKFSTNSKPLPGPVGAQQPGSSVAGGRERGFKFNQRSGCEWWPAEAEEAGQRGQASGGHSKRSRKASTSRATKLAAGKGSSSEADIGGGQQQQEQRAQLATSNELDDNNHNNGVDADAANTNNNRRHLKRKRNGTSSGSSHSSTRRSLGKRSMKSNSTNRDAESTDMTAVSVSTNGNRATSGEGDLPEWPLLNEDSERDLLNDDDELEDEDEDVSDEEAETGSESGPEEADEEAERRHRNQPGNNVARENPGGSSGDNQHDNISSRGRPDHEGSSGAVESERFKRGAWKEEFPATAAAGAVAATALASPEIARPSSEEAPLSSSRTQ